MYDYVTFHTSMSHTSHTSMSHVPVACRGYRRQCGWVLQCVAVCCSALQCVCVVVCCSVLQCAAVCCSAWQCIAVRYSVLQCAAVRQIATHAVNKGVMSHERVMSLRNASCHVCMSHEWVMSHRNNSCHTRKSHIRFLCLSLFRALTSPKRSTLTIFPSFLSMIKPRHTSSRSNISSSTGNPTFVCVCMYVCVSMCMCV